MKSVIIVAILLFSTTLFAQNDAVIRTKNFNLEKGVAIQGYDPVAYFTLNKGIKGSNTISTNYNGIVYYFATTENRETFKKNPAQYEPQYGGWCAYAMGKNGEKVSIDPETFKIINGKLFLFYHTFINNTLKSWNADEANLLTKADANWTKFVGK